MIVQTVRQYLDVPRGQTVTLFNFGDTLYVGDQTVSAGANESTVLNGGTVTLTAGRYLVSAGWSRVEEDIAATPAVLSGSVQTVVRVAAPRDARTATATGLFYALVGSANAKPVALNDAKRVAVTLRNLSPSQTLTVGVVAQGQAFTATPASYDYTLVAGAEMTFPGTGGVWAYFPTTADLIEVTREAVA